MSNDGNDLCPMCNGEGKHNLQPPNGGIYIRIKAVNGEESAMENSYVFNSYSKAIAHVNKLAAEGYEMHSFQENKLSTTWMMQWRWR